ncbi:putative ribosome biogenesis GTPase RsgA [Actinomadura sp. NBRC 104412]|uniref:ribosome small subunit-dependent GTPase A n=1 Tax=Actinomadura sp. NBRC 104412 TaxID=3032203 RepID=UPI0024A56071|nr:ribosome small subunit-dependent GTPase A [Actinomadura sp. NBRC 104412]GLZ03348.1 putative ribosome biogenesis GTPase RsgA [Actinomadura sp. NBRC 104412]
MTSSPSHTLSAYGWNGDLEHAFAPYRATGLIPARVAAVDRGRCDAITETGPVRADTAPVASPDPTQGPCTGDWAALSAGERPAITALLPRRTALVRATASRDSHGQVLAANIDTVAVTLSLTARFAAGRVERLLALAWESGARPVIVLTKSDLLADPAAEAALTAQTAAAAPGVDVVPCSASTGTGMDAVTAALTGTIALIGPSGAGKSTLGNALLGADHLATGAVRETDGRGRHTTVRRELLPLPGGGVLIDTPGLRGIGLFDAGEGIRQVFADVEELAGRCRFADCAHATEPGCAVLAAIEDGALPARRLDAYRKLLRENAWAASRGDARLRAERSRRRREITRSLRQSYQIKGKRR